MKQDNLSLATILGIVRRNWWGVVVCTLAFVVASYLLVRSLPKKYRSKATISIQASYFQNPLVNNLISDVNDPSELRAQRSALIQLALSDAFIDELGEKFDIYRAAPNDKRRILEREQLLADIQYVSLSSNSFLISTIGPSSEAAYRMNKRVIQRIVDTLIEERQRGLSKTREALAEHLQTLSSIIQSNEPVPAENVERIAELERDLSKVQAQIARLSQQFTEQHPDLQKQRRQANALRSQISALQRKNANAVVKPKNAPTDSALALASARKPIAEVHDDLVKKLSNLEIVMSLEKDRDNLTYVAVIEQPNLPVSPFLPNRKMYLAVGALLGLMVSLALTLYLELKRGTFGVFEERPDDLLGVPIVGALPPAPVPPRALLPGVERLPTEGTEPKDLSERLLWLSERGTG